MTEREYLDSLAAKRWERIIEEVHEGNAKRLENDLNGYHVEIGNRRNGNLEWNGYSGWVAAR